MNDIAQFLLILWASISGVVGFACALCFLIEKPYRLSSFPPEARAVIGLAMGIMWPLIVLRTIARGVWQLVRVCKPPPRVAPPPIPEARTVRR